MNTHRILALDLGSFSAYATNVGVGAENYVYNSMKFTPGRLCVLPEFDVWLNITLSTTQPHFVVYERPFARGMAATRMLWGLAGVVELNAIKRGCGVIDVTPAEIKHHIIGKGNASKEAMISAVEKLGYKPANEHEADAIALLRYTIDNSEVITDAIDSSK